jgi:hypothetical protein
MRASAPAERHRRARRERRCTGGLCGSNHLWAALLLAFIGLSGCSYADYLAGHSTEYNVQAEIVKNQNLLNNIIRSAYRKPLQFTDLSSITGMVSMSGSAGFTVPFGGPRTGFIFTPNMSGSNTPTFTVSVLNTKEFYQGILHPIDAQIISFYLNERFPPLVLLTLLVSEIEFDDHIFRNDTGVHYVEDTKKLELYYSDFRLKLRELIDSGLTVKPVNETKVLGPSFSANDIAKMDIGKLDGQGVAITPYQTTHGTSYRL